MMADIQLPGSFPRLCGFMALLMSGSWVSVIAHLRDAAQHQSIGQSAHSCAADVEKSNPRSLLQLSQGQDKIAEKHAFEVVKSAADDPWQCKVGIGGKTIGLVLKETRAGCEAKMKGKAFMYGGNQHCQEVTDYVGMTNGNTAWVTCEEVANGTAYLQHDAKASPSLKKGNESSSDDPLLVAAHIPCPYDHFFNGSGWAGYTADRKVTFVTIYDAMFETNLGKSSLWLDRINKPHQWIVFDNQDNRPISQLYAEAQSDALSDLVVFLHSDIWLPDDFYESFISKLDIIENIDKNWGVLGAVGVPFGEFRSNSSITDFSQTYTTGHDFLPVQGVDECFVVLRKGSPAWDPNLPGFDLYGLDIVLSARQLQQMSYLLNVKVTHKLKDAQDNVFLNTTFDAKVDSAEYSKKVDTTAQYFQQKWCNSGFLPVMGPSFRVECDAWCKVITMLNRSHHNETCVDPTGEYQTHPTWEF